MSGRGETDAEHVLVLAPTGRDGEMVRDLLRDAAIGCELCVDLDDLITRLREGAGAIVLAQEALHARGAAEAILEALGTQEPWSDVPLVLLTLAGPRSHPAVSLLERANVILLQRPLSTQLLLSAVRSGLRARRRQYEMRALHTRLARAVQLAEMLVTILAHDLRGPLAAVRVAAESIQRWSQETRTLDYAGRIVSSTSRMDRMIGQLLDFARIRQGQGIRLRVREADLGQLSRDVLREVEQANPQTSFEMNVSGDLLGSWDPDRLAQLVGNLAANAAQHGAQGQPVTIVLDGSDVKNVRLTFTNTGAIAPSDVSILFEPFAGSQPRAASGGGLGLGLFIAREITRAHGGEITVQPHPSAKLVTFAVTLPRIAVPGDTQVIRVS